MHVTYSSPLYDISPFLRLAEHDSYNLRCQPPLYLLLSVVLYHASLGRRPEDHGPLFNLRQILNGFQDTCRELHPKGRIAVLDAMIDKHHPQTSG